MSRTQQLAMRVRCAVLVLAVGVALLGCGGTEPSAPDGARTGIRIASFDFVESQLLAEVYAVGLERAGLPVERHLALGPREIVLPALEQGQVDLVPEYAGSLLRFVTGTSPPFDLDALRAQLDAALAPRDLVPLAFAPGQDQNGVVVTADTAIRLGLREVSDLVPVAGDLSFGGPPECAQRPLCLLGLAEVYGLQFGEFVPFDSRAVTAEALLAGQIDVGMLETVDAYLADGRLVLLEDDGSLQPPEHIVPVLRAAVRDERGDQLVSRLNAVSATLTDAALVDLHRQVVLDGRPLADVATDWIEAHGLG